MKAAVDKVLEGRPLNVVTREFNIDRMTLKRYCCKKKLNPNESFKPNYNNKVFTAEGEKSLSSYLLLSSKMNFLMKVVNNLINFFQVNAFIGI